MSENNDKTIIQRVIRLQNVRTSTTHQQHKSRHLTQRETFGSQNQQQQRIRKKSSHRTQSPQ
eukprot:1302470-Amphidinium_carterae.1